MFYGANVWDPLLIISQIVALQCLCYLGLGLVQWLVVSPYHHAPISLRFLFDWRFVSLRTFTGGLNVVAFLLNACLLALLIVPVVGRAKKCLDFASTVYIWHTVFTAAAYGWPGSLSWWAVMGTCFAITALMSEWLCLQRELRDIPLGSVRERAKGSAAVRAPAGGGVPAGERRAGGSGPLGAVSSRPGSSNLTIRDIPSGSGSTSTQRLVSGPNAV
uniref:Coatomer subunit beta-1 n=1 Tax=Tetraselmis sp. GSL018 TaxID=582737 RepID=A0A061SGP8_9CHLO|mmetsp:Transcript_26613/g.63068  ORF Transcript_26613/g.63068 Transcript_26613/m.63068 type:complete len:217 (-) Transcript_26613:190-840(-)